MSGFEQGDLLADEGMARAEAGADEGWLRAAKHVVWQLIREGQPFTTDVVWYRLEALGVSTSEPRALGAVIKAASAGGFLRSTGVYDKSTRPECHSRPVLRWQPVRQGAAA